MIEDIKLERAYREYTVDAMKKAIGDARQMVHDEISPELGTEAIAIIAVSLFRHRSDPYHFWAQRNSVKVLEEKTKKEAQNASKA